jgi:hypothetical protein
MRGSVTSIDMASALPPADSISPTTCALASSCRSATATMQPSSAKASAIARPMPLAAPVTSAILSSLLVVISPTKIGSAADACAQSPVAFHIRHVVGWATAMFSAWMVAVCGGCERDQKLGNGVSGSGGLCRPSVTKRYLGRAASRCVGGAKTPCILVPSRPPSDPRFAAPRVRHSSVAPGIDECPCCVRRRQGRPRLFPM